MRSERSPRRSCSSWPLIEMLFAGSAGIVGHVGVVSGRLRPQGQDSLVAIFLFLLPHHVLRSAKTRPTAASGPSLAASHV